jgi:hypothetical protein
MGLNLRMVFIILLKLKKLFLYLVIVMSNLYTKCGKTTIKGVKKGTNNRYVKCKGGAFTNLRDFDIFTINILAEIYVQEYNDARDNHEDVSEYLIEYNKAEKVIEYYKQFEKTKKDIIANENHITKYETMIQTYINMNSIYANISQNKILKQIYNETSVNEQVALLKSKIFDLNSKIFDLKIRFEAYLMNLNVAANLFLWSIRPELYDSAGNLIPIMERHPSVIVKSLTTRKSRRA